MSAYTEAEALHAALTDLIEQDHLALANLAAGGIASSADDSVLEFLSWLHREWRFSLEDDRRSGALTEQTRMLQAICERMLRIWEA